MEVDPFNDDSGQEFLELITGTDKEACFTDGSLTVANNDGSTELGDRFNSGNWPKYGSSIYVDAFNLALETVLKDECHLFDNAEKGVFDQWKSLNYEAQYLYVRLFLRKASTWHRIQKLAYHNDVKDLTLAANNLQALRNIPCSSSPLQLDHGVSIPQEQLLGQNFRFANNSETDITSLEEALSLLSLEELKVIAKEAKVQGKNKKELINSFSRVSRQQSGLRWKGIFSSLNQQTNWPYNSKKRNQDGEIKRAAVRCDIETKDMIAVDNNNRDGHYLRIVLDSMGPCIRLSLPTLNLFERVHLVFYRSTEWTEKSLTAMILARISRRNFPQYIVSRSASIFASRSILVEYEAALRVQCRVESILQSTEALDSKGSEEILQVLEDIYSRWKVLVEAEQRKEICIYDNEEDAYLRCFSPAWVYTRIIYKAVYVLGKVKKHEREHQILTGLLSQHPFHVSKRGAWYQRKALIEENYLAVLDNVGLENLASRRKHWQRVSLQTCEQGLQDRNCHIIYHYDLQKRIMKLERQLRVAKKDQHYFGHVTLRSPVERIISGTLIKRACQKFESAKGTRTVWVDEQNGDCECSVETMCLSEYRRLGWRGYHSEGGIITTLFAYLFCDILFTYVPNVFQTPYQTCPLDLHTDAFYVSRESEINRRLVQIENGDADQLIREVDHRERGNKTCIVGLDWSFQLEDLLEIARCFPGSALAIVCKVIAQGYRERRKGVPDLFLWNSDRKEVMFAEVKSANDRLSDTQRLWIHVLISSGVAVEICNAVAKEVCIK